LKLQLTMIFIHLDHFRL